MTDYKQLCAELLSELENAIRVIYREDGTRHISSADPVIAKADAALAQPEPEPERPTDEELAITARKAVKDYRYCTELPYFLRDDSSEYEPFLLILRAVLEKYGKTTSGESIEVNPAMAEPQSLLPKTLADIANAEYTDAVLRGDCVPIQKMPMLRRALEKLWDLEHHNA